VLAGLTLDKGSVTVTWHSHCDFSLSSARYKLLDKEDIADKQFVKSSLLSATLGKASAEYLRHGKEVCSGSVG
jgi:hypothetical protein